jgi:rhodanese-related sulfurtransferase
MTRNLRLLIFCLTSILLISHAFAEEEFPLRKKFPSLQTITTEALEKEFGRVIIVDVRAKFEYDVLHIKDAIHAPMSNTDFLSRLEKVRDKDGPAKLVFYCNGHTCPKSYEACDAAAKAGFKNILAYDAGVFDWAVAHPDKGVFFGATPVDKSKLIDKASLKARSLSYAQFKEGKGIFIDVRDPIQRKFIPDIKDLKSVSLDKLLPLLDAKNFINDELFFLDEVGKQVEWLDYYLMRNGYKNYHFLDRGVEAIKK